MLTEVALPLNELVFFKLQLVLFFEGIRSERLLMRHAADRLSVRWFLGYELSGTVARSFQPDEDPHPRRALRSFVALQEAIVEQCQEAGLIWGRELYFDGTKVAANAGKESVKPREAREAHLRNLFDTEAEEPVDEEEQQRAQEEPAGSDAPVPLPVSLSPAAYEELALHNEARHDWTRASGSTRSQRERPQLSTDRRLSGQHD